MRRFLLILTALGLLSAPALADSTVPSLTAATTLSGATLYVANGGASDNKAGLSTTIFDISAGNVIIKSGGISATMLASTAVTPATYGDSTHVGQFTVDQQGRITAASSVAISGGGGSITATAGGNTQTSVTTLAFGNGFTTTNGSSGTAPVNLSVTDTSKTANYSVAAGDMANALSLGGSGATLTLPAASSIVFAPGMTVNFSTRSATGNWTVTNSTGLTYAGPTTLVPGTEGAFVANADGVTLDFFGFTTPTTTLLGGSKAISASGSQFLTGLGTDGVYTRAQPAFSDISGTASAAQIPVATTSSNGGVKVDGTSITITGGVISATTGGGGTVTTLTAGTNVTFSSGATCTTTCTINASGGGSSAPAIPQGRLSLTTGLPVMRADTTAATTLFYDTYQGNQVPVWNGSAMVGLTIGSDEISMGLSATNHPASSFFDVFAISSGGTLTLCTVAWTNSTTRASAISLKSGVWTISAAPSHCFGGASGTTDFGSSGSGAIGGANQATLVGCMATTGTNGQTAMQFTPAAASGGTNTWRGISNVYNRVSASSMVIDTAGWLAAGSTFGPVHASNSWRANYFDCLGDMPVDANYVAQQIAIASAKDYVAGLCLNATNCTPAATFTIGNINAPYVSASISDAFKPVLGFNFVSAVEEFVGSAIGPASASMRLNTTY